MADSRSILDLTLIPLASELLALDPASFRDHEEAVSIATRLDGLTGSTLYDDVKSCVEEFGAARVVAEMEERTGHRGDGLMQLIRVLCWRAELEQLQCRSN